MSVPLAYVVNPFFDELTLNIRERPMSWEGYQKASLITEGELDLLKTFETNYTPNKSNNQESEPVSESYLLLLLDLLNKLVRVDTLQYILVLIDDILDANPENIKVIQNLKNSRQGYPIEPFLKCLHKDDDFLALKAEKILTALISTGGEDYSASLQPFLDSLVLQLSSKTPNVADITVQILQSLLKNVSYRFQFYSHSQGISGLINLLKSDQLNPQIQYQILFCIWILTFQTKIAHEIQFRFNILPILSNIAKSTVKEKIVRVIVGTFKNLLERSPEVNIQCLLNFKIHQLSETLSQRKWTDEEIVEDLEYLKENLETACRNLTTWDEYRAELESGILEWSPPHSSPHFWKENASKLEDENNELLNILINILNTSNDPLYLSIAAHDIGQYVQYSPKGKSLIEELGGKRRIMELMTHENPDVKYHALVSLQNCLMHSWDKQ